MFKSANRLRRDEDFQVIFSNGKRAANRVFYLHTRLGTKRIGIVVSKKHGKAVVRNKLKRRIREIIIPLLPQFKAYDVIIVPRVGASSLSFEELRRNLIHVLKVGGVIK